MFWGGGEDVKKKTNFNLYLHEFPCNKRFKSNSAVLDAKLRGFKPYEKFALFVGA